jgi:hypothetical protein
MQDSQTTAVFYFDRIDARLAFYFVRKSLESRSIQALSSSQQQCARGPWVGPPANRPAKAHEPKAQHGWPPPHAKERARGSWACQRWPLASSECARANAPGRLRDALGGASQGLSLAAAALFLFFLFISFK